MPRNVMFGFEFQVSKLINGMDSTPHNNMNHSEIIRHCGNVEFNFYLINIFQQL